MSSSTSTQKSRRRKPDDLAYKLFVRRQYRSILTKSPKAFVSLQLALVPLKLKAYIFTESVVTYFLYLLFAGLGWED